MVKHRHTRGDRFANAPPLEDWPTVLVGALPESDKELFLTRSKAITMYAEGFPVKKIMEVTGMPRNNLSYFANRCLRFGSDGRILGFRALIPYYRIKPYVRTKSGGYKFPEAQGGMSGAMSRVLAEFPDIDKKLRQYIRKEATADLHVHEKRISINALHRLFLKSLKAAGLGEIEWPFNTKHKGKRSLQSYLNRVLDESFDRSVRTREEQVAAAHLAVGAGQERFLRFEEPFDAVQLDAYNINAFFTVEFDTPEGTTTEVLLERIWLIALIEFISGSVLSYSVVYRSEVSAEDVLDVIRMAIRPAERLELTIPELRYPESGGLPAEVIPACKGAMWGAILLDGALAHLSNAITVRARKHCGFVINWGPVAHFERRPDVERYFNEISNNIFLRLPSTTGSNPGKGRAKNADQQALRHKIRANEVEQLIAVYTAQHNSTPSEGLSYNSPLDVLNGYFGRNPDHFLLRHLPIRAKDAAGLIPIIKECVIRGGRSVGRRPYVQIDGAKYTSPLMAHSPELIGMRVLIEMMDDYRYGTAYLKSNGAELGLVSVMGRWSATRHSYKTRKIINRLIAKRILVVSSTDDPIQVYLSYLSKKGRNSGHKKPVLKPSNATEATRISKESGLPRKITADNPSTAIPIMTLSQLQDRPSVMSTPMPDLNKLLKGKR